MFLLHVGVSSVLCRMSVSTDRSKRPPVKVLSSQLREGEGGTGAGGRSEVSIRRLGRARSGSLRVSVVWMQGTVLELQPDNSAALLLDQTGNFVVNGLNGIPRGKPCLIPGQHTKYSLHSFLLYRHEGPGYPWCSGF